MSLAVDRDSGHLLILFILFPSKPTLH